MRPCLQPRNTTKSFIRCSKYVVQSLIFFAYWTYFELRTGQPLGKWLLKIKATDMSGKVADLRNVAIQSFGKAFLLPIHVFFCWIFTNDKRQRLLSKAANTIVLKAQQEDSNHLTQNVGCRKECCYRS